MTNICKECGKPFTAKTKRTVYCSDECRKLVKKRQNKKYRESNKEYLNLYNRYQRQRDKEAELKKVKARVKCEKAHNGCFSCPTKDGECLFEF